MRVPAERSALENAARQRAEAAVTHRREPDPSRARRDRRLPTAPAGGVRSDPAPPIPSFARLARRACVRLGIGLFALLAAGAPLAVAAGTPHPLQALVGRMDAFMRRNEVGGVTRDPRHLQNPTEEIRLTITPQLLAYYELNMWKPRPRYARAIVTRANFLIDNFDGIVSGTAFDGMLGYALLAAFEVTGDSRYFVKARQIVDQVRALEGFRNTLNWGLMAALALSKYYAMTGDTLARAKVLSIVQSLRPYQHADGSFPHYCPGSRDVHYTAWMCMEMLTVLRHIDHSSIHQILGRCVQFLRSRVGTTGETIYEEACPGPPGCVIYYDSKRSGCAQDIDTRGWVNELGYTALTLERFGVDQQRLVHGFLARLERGAQAAGVEMPDRGAAMPGAPRGSFASWSEGRADALAEDGEEEGLRTEPDPPPPPAPGGEGDEDWRWGGVFPDKWGYRPEPWEPIYIWASAESSVVRTSVIFWSLAQALASSKGPILVAAAQAAGAAGGPTRAMADLEPGPEEVWEVAPAESLALAVIEGREAGAPAWPLRSQGGVREPVREVEEERRSTPAREVAAPVGLAVVETVRGERATVRFQLPRDSRVSVDVFDVTGRRIRALSSGRFLAGTHRVVWDGRTDSEARVPTGIYLVRIRTEEGDGTVKVPWVAR